jgi:hypothetical protein
LFLHRREKGNSKGKANEATPRGKEKDEATNVAVGRCRSSQG